MRTLIARIVLALVLCGSGVAAARPFVHDGYGVWLPRNYPYKVVGHGRDQVALAGRMTDRELGDWNEAMRQRYGWPAIQRQQREAAARRGR